MKRGVLPATAVIFCGGRSARMGTDKAFLDWGGRPLALHVASRLQPHFAEIVISGDPARYAALGLPCIPDLGGAGPLAGLYASLFASRTAAIFAVACDMPLVEPRSARALWEHLRGYDAAVPVSGDSREPLHAFYLKRLLPVIGRALEGKARMAGWWGEAAVKRVRAASLPGGADAMTDCDTLEDYRRIKAGAAVRRPPGE
ncbi:MAG: molybdenum cofactor guanylyltransferase [Planctomycetes bacterium]|nr:molybdenum cofactor guanylyltransferase [Planctomycetota bacterium]